MQPTLLHLGAGTRRIPGFINIDIEAGAELQLDLTQPLPWDDGSVHGIFSEHFIEHISQADAIRLLHECRRVLAPGGIVRIATPDLRDVVLDYVHGRIHPDWEKFGLSWTANACERLNIAMRWWGHKWVYDEEELTRLGLMVGLRPMGRYRIGESDNPLFRNLEYRESSTLILEFCKPDRRLAADALPLVSITIPSYKPEFFETALQSALNQTYTNTEIVICDDCPDDRVMWIVEKYAADHPNIRYFRNEQRLIRENLIKCVDMAQGDFVKFLNDDDVLAENCIERMLDCYRTHPDISLVTSRRQRIDAEGRPLADIFETLPPVEEDAVIDGLTIGTALLSSGRNFVGEPTTAMFRKSDIDYLKPDCMAVDNLKVNGVIDIALWVNLSTVGDTAYLVEPLSQFRIHGNQAQLAFRDECVAAALEGFKTMRASWDRRELSKNQRMNTIRWKPLGQPTAAWRVHTIHGQAEGWAAVASTEPATTTPVPGGTTAAANSDWTAYCKAEQLQEEGREQEAIDVLLGLARNGTTCWQVYNDLGIYAFNMGDAANAQNLLHHAMGLSAIPTAASLNLANVLVAIGDSDKAMQLLSAYLSHHPNDNAAKKLRDELVEIRQKA